MMYSFLPVPEDRAGAIITLVGLGHERRGYAGRSVYARGYGIQAGSVGLATTTSIQYESSRGNTIVQYLYVVT
jgi:hypothetical protein